jgi:hypothetical protein
VPKTKQLVPTWVNSDGNASTTQIVFTGNGLALVTDAVAFDDGSLVVSAISLGKSRSRADRFAQELYLSS